MNQKRMLVSGIAAALAFASSHPVAAQKAVSTLQSAALAASSTVFTVRYVCIVATPKTALSPEEAQASLQQLPSTFDEMQHGSTRSMADTPTAFIISLRAAQPDYTFKTLLSGSTRCDLGDQQAAIISDGPDPSEYHMTLADSIFLVRNSPTNLTIHHTGQITATHSPTFRGGPGWLNTTTDKIVIGRVYTQGVDNLPDGRHIAYAFCVLPGDLDRTASAWNVGKVNTLRKTASATAAGIGGRR